MRYAHTENGYAMDVQDAPDVETYKRRLGPPEVTDAWTVEIVDAEVKDNWRPKEDGGWEAPPEPVQIEFYAALTGKQFEVYAATTLGTVHGNGPAAGLTRMGEIIRAARQADSEVDGKVEIAYQRYVAATGPGGKFVAAEVASFAETLAAAGVCTPEEASALSALEAWPKH